MRDGTVPEWPRLGANVIGWDVLRDGMGQDRKDSR